MIAIGSDHGGFELKQEIMKHLAELGLEYKDFGTYTTDSCDYPVYGEAVARSVVAKECDLGVLICGTGCGISLAANNVPGCRCCNCSEPYTAAMSRRHNNANVIAFGARVVGSDMAKLIVETFLTNEFEGGRHQRRVDMIDAIQ